MERTSFYNLQGRWPANLILDEEAGRMLDEQSGISKSTPRKPKKDGTLGHKGVVTNFNRGSETSSHKGSGGASRFFYCAKASKKERGEGNKHPTVKPLALMEYLCKLTKTPKGGKVLDPFGGSGTTALACINTERDCVIIEKEPEYCEIARKRINAYS